MSLIERMAEIQTELMAIVSAATYPEPIDKFIIGEKFRMSGRLDKPLLWVLTTDCSLKDQGMSINEYCAWDILLISVVKAHSDSDGKERAEAIALAASKAIIQNRTLNGKILDAVRKTFTPAYTQIFEQDESLWGSAVTIELRFVNRES